MSEGNGAATQGAAEEQGFFKSPQDAVAGLFLVVLGGAVMWASSNLGLGRGSQLGAGSFPRGLGLMVFLNGVALLAIAKFHIGEKLERWNLRGILFVLGAVVVFAVTVRPLGLLVAGPLLLMLSGLATEETRWKELAIFSVVMTALCIGLFKLVLKLPMPVAPWLGW